ncbi:MAG: hypothetical protein ABII94_02630 [Patescibacteria group bacterium]
MINKKFIKKLLIVILANLTTAFCLLNALKGFEIDLTILQSFFLVTSLRYIFVNGHPD